MRFDLDLMILAKFYFPFSSKVLYCVKELDHKPIKGRRSIDMKKEKSKSFEIDMCNGPILKKMLLFALPLMCSSILQLLFNAVDVIVVGQYVGDNALAAVGSTSSLIHLFVNFFIGLSIGVNVLVANYYGAKQERHLSETVHTAMAISIVSGVFLAIIGVIFSPSILRMMQTPEEVLPLASVYLRVYFVGMPVLMIYNFGAAILRAIGDTRRPLFYLVIAGVLNVTLNLFFVIVLHWGVFGVGFATVISQVVSGGLVLRCLTNESGGIRVDFKKMRFHKDKMKKILQIGLPAGIQSILFSISNVLIQSSVNSFGAITVAGNSAAANVEGFVYAAMNTFYQANISFTGQNMGAGKYNRLRRILLTAVGCVTVVGLLAGSACYIAGPTLLTLYTDSPSVIAAGMVRLTYIGSIYVLCGIMEVLVGSLRGMGYAVVPMIVSLIGTCGLRILWLQVVFPIERFHNIDTVYVIYPITWILTTLAHAISFIIIRKRILKKTSVQ